MFIVWDRRRFVGVGVGVAEDDSSSGCDVYFYTCVMIMVFGGMTPCMLNG